MLDFYKVNKRKPREHDEGMSGIGGAIHRGDWEEYGIGTWNDLMRLVFNEVNLNYNYLKGKKGLERAVKILKNVKKAKNRLPQINDENLGGIVDAATRKKYWTKFGIESWNDLLRYAFGNVRIQPGKYCGKEGLELATKILKDFEKNNRRLPRTIDKGIGGIVIATNRGEWREFEISKWDDLLMFVFQKTNRTSKYDGIEGLHIVLEKLKIFQQRYGRIPTSNDKGMSKYHKPVLKRSGLNLGFMVGKI